MFVVIVWNLCENWTFLLSSGPSWSHWPILVLGPWITMTYILETSAQTTLVQRQLKKWTIFLASSDSHK